MLKGWHTEHLNKISNKEGGWRKHFDQAWYDESYCHQPFSTSLSQGHLNTSVQYHSWCSPGYSTSLPHPEKSFSFSCSVWTSQPGSDFPLALLKTQTGWTPPSGLERWATPCHLWRRKGPGGLPGSKRRLQHGEEGGFLKAPCYVARCSGHPALWHHWWNSTGKGLKEENYKRNYFLVHKVTSDKTCNIWYKNKKGEISYAAEICIYALYKSEKHFFCYIFIYM